MSYLIVSDIDHTLLDQKGRLLEHNSAALKRAVASGATVVLATARSYGGALPVYQALGLDTPLVVSNGTLIYDRDGKVLRSKLIDGATVREVFDLFLSTPHHWALRQDDIAYLHPDFDRSREPFDNRRFYRDGHPPSLDKIVSMSLFGPMIRPFYDAHNWEERRLFASFYPPSHYNPGEGMSLITAQAGKGEAVAWLREHLGLADAPTLLLGDSPDDATMFGLGTGVAPADAHPQAIEKADWVGPGCDDALVAAALERFVFGELESPSRVKLAAGDD